MKNIKVKTAFCILSIILAAFYSKVYGAIIEESFYTVYLNNFSPKILTDKISRYKIISPDDFDLPRTSFQQTPEKKNYNGIYNLIIQSGEINGNISLVKEGVNNYLADSRLLNLDNPEIKKATSQFKKSDDIVEDLERFVYSHISNKILGIPIMPAAEILKSKSGDCTEHTILAVALLRSKGVPARALMGMFFTEEFQGIKNTFVYHMWAEAYVNGKWVIVDAANPGEKHENRYIAFAYHHLQTEIPLSYLKAVSAIKSFKVELID